MTGCQELLHDFVNVPVSDTVGERVGALRRAKKRADGRRWTQQDLAAAVGVAKGTIANWETGVQKPSGENLLALARELGAPIEYILHGGNGVSEGHDTIHGMDTSALNLPDVSYLHPRARAVFNEAIGSYLTRGWTFETIESAAVALLGYFTGTSTLRSSGVSQPELSEDEQVMVLEGAKEEVEHVFGRRGRGSGR